MDADGSASRSSRRSEAPVASGPWLSAAAGVATFVGVCGFFFSFDDPWTLRGDNKAALYPLGLAAYRSWLSGAVPEWSGGLWAGYPLLSDPTSGSLYWPNFFFFWLTPEPHLRAFDLATAFHLALMTAGSVRLLQALGASPSASLFGGLLTLLAPTQQWFASAILHSFSPLAWWPWTFLAAERLSRAGSRVLSGPMLVGWLALASQALWYPEFALYSGVIASLWLVARTGGAPILQRGLKAATLCAGGLALAAPQLLPTVLYQSSSIRAAAIPLADATALSFFGSPWMSIVPGATAGAIPQFIGAATLVLAAVALIRRQPRAVFLSVVALLGFALALGARTPLYGLLHALPPFDRFRSPMKFFLLVQFSSVWLAGLGANELLRRRAARWLGIAALVLMSAAVTERVAFDVRRFREEARFPGGRSPTFATDHERMLRSGLIEAASAEPGQPPPRILETVGLQNLPMLYDLEQVLGGPTPLLASRHRQLLPAAGRFTKRMSRAKLDLWGVHYLLAPRAACADWEERAGLILRFETETTCLFENPGRPPRFSLLGAFRDVSSWAVMASFVRSNPGGPIPVQRPAGDTDSGSRIADGSVEVAAYRPGAVRLAVDAQAPALLLVRESLIDGWRAEVDGAEVALYPAAGIFFAVPVPAGLHEVRLSYHAPGFRPGLLVSASWILCAGAVWAFLRYGRVGRRSIFVPGVR